MTMRWGYDPGEVEYLEQQEGRNAPGSLADNQEMVAGLVAGARAKRGDAFPSGRRGEREIKQPLASPTPTLPARTNYGPGGEPGFFPGEPVAQPYQQPMFNQFPIWNIQPGQQGFADMGYSINPYNPNWAPPFQSPDPMNYYPNNPGMQGVNRTFTPQEMNPGMLAGLLGQYGNPFWQQIGQQGNVSNPMMSGIQRLLNRSAPARYGSRGR